MRITSVGAELFNADMTKLIATFHNFTKHVTVKEEKKSISE